MADVMAVADRAVVLRLGRNNGEYNIADVTSATLIAAITGATDNEVTRRATEAPIREPSAATGPGTLPQPPGSPARADAKITRMTDKTRVRKRDDAGDA
jgi:hypothetical protein